MAETPVSIAAALEEAKRKQRESERIVAVLQAAADVEQLAAQAPTQQETYRVLKDRLERETHEAQKARDAAVAERDLVISESRGAIAHAKGDLVEAQQQHEAEAKQAAAQAADDRNALQQALDQAKALHEIAVSALNAEEQELRQRVSNLKAELAAIAQRATS